MKKSLIASALLASLAFLFSCDNADAETTANLFSEYTFTNATNRVAIFGLHQDVNVEASGTSDIEIPSYPGYGILLSFSPDELSTNAKLNATVQIATEGGMAELVALSPDAQNTLNTDIVDSITYNSDDSNVVVTLNSLPLTVFSEQTLSATATIAGYTSATLEIVETAPHLRLTLHPGSSTGSDKVLYYNAFGVQLNADNQAVEITTSALSTRSFPSVVNVTGRTTKAFAPLDGADAGAWHQMSFLTGTSGGSAGTVIGIAVGGAHGDTNTTAVTQLRYSTGSIGETNVHGTPDAINMSGATVFTFDNSDTFATADTRYVFGGITPSWPARITTDDLFATSTTTHLLYQVNTAATLTLPGTSGGISLQGVTATAFGALTANAVVTVLAASAADNYLVNMGAGITTGDVTAVDGGNVEITTSDFTNTPTVVVEVGADATTP